MRTSSLAVRRACDHDLDAIDEMIKDFLRGHPAEHHPRPREVLRAAYLSANPVARLFVAVKAGRVIGMGQWSRIFEMFWAMHGGRPEYLYVRPEWRGSNWPARVAAPLATGDESDRSVNFGRAVSSNRPWPSRSGSRRRTPPTWARYARSSSG